MLMATRVDPLLLVLPIMSQEKTRKTFSPIGQLLADAAAESKTPHTLRLRQCKHLALEKICEVNDTMADMGEDYMMFRLDEQKTVAYLKRKAERVRALMERNFVAREAPAAHCGSSPSNFGFG